MIQLAATKTFQSPASYRDKFKLSGEVLYYEKEGWYKYVTGEFSTQKEAAAKMAQLGIKGFVTAIDKSLLKDK